MIKKENTKLLYSEVPNNCVYKMIIFQKKKSTLYSLTRNCTVINIQDYPFHMNLIWVQITCQTAAVLHQK